MIYAKEGFQLITCEGTPLPSWDTVAAPQDGHGRVDGLGEDFPICLSTGNPAQT
jgi:hypothetical protein